MPSVELKAPGAWTTPSLHRVFPGSPEAHILPNVIGRVEFIEGEPSRMTKAEKTRLEERGLTGVRLSCQILCDHDMTVRPVFRLEGSGRPDPGRTPEPTIQPPPEWI